MFGFAMRREYDGDLANRIQEFPWKTFQGLHQSLIPNRFPQPESRRSTSPIAIRCP